MNKKLVILAAALMQIGAASALIGNGVGASCKEAVDDAELDALKRTGNMVVHSSATQDGQYHSSTHQYTSGITNGRTVLDCIQDGGLFRAKVDVDVIPGKDNTIIVSDMHDETWMRDFQAARATAQKQQQFVDSFGEMPVFAVAPDAMTVKVMGKQTEYRIKYKVRWQPKLVSDVRSYAELSGVRLKQPSMDYPYTLCFGSFQQATTESCWGLAATIPGVDKRYSVKLQAKQGNTIVEQHHTLADEKLKFVSNKGTLLFSDGVVEGEFVLYLDTEAGALSFDSITIEPVRPAVFR